MATPRFARVASATALGPDTRLLELELLVEEALGFSGGQYVIVDSGLVLPNGKAAKRAYSILSVDAEQGRFTLCSKRIPGGLVSGFLHDVAVGTEIRFSGPWGKLLPAEGAAGQTLVLATDTGITAAIGLCSGRRFAPLLAGTILLWLRPTPGYFLPEAFVRARLPAGLGSVAIESLPPIDHPERLPWVRARVGDLVRAPGLRQAFLAGDGAVNYTLLDDLQAAGVAATRDNVESFFNMPKKTSTGAA